MAAGEGTGGRVEVKIPKLVLWVAGIVLALIAILGIGLYKYPISFFNHLLYWQMSMSGAHSRWVTVNGIRIHYYVQGPEDAPPALLIHGLGGHAEDWRNLTHWVIMAHRRVYVPDLPGYGRSDWPKNFSYSIPDEAAAMVGFMDALGLKRVDLAGWSMGGWVAQQIAIDHPDRVATLMLFDSAGLHEQPAWDVALFTPTTAAQLDQLDALLMPHPPQVPAFIARAMLRKSREHAWVMHRAMDSMMTGKSTTDKDLPKLKMPVLLAWGSEDKIIPVTEGEQMHKLMPQSELEVVKGCGHLAPVQCADRMGPKVEQFLKAGNRDQATGNRERQ
jgi:pimeloyl-ACP methyl ester carboxylesterase